MAEFYVKLHLLINGRLIVSLLSEKFEKTTTGKARFTKMVIALLRIDHFRKSKSFEISMTLTIRLISNLNVKINAKN